MPDMARAKKAQQSKLLVRNATLEDVPAIQALTIKVYPTMSPYPLHTLRGQINNYPEGQFIAVYDDNVVGYCATFRIDAEWALKPHTWKEITGSGFASRHNNEGSYLYGMEVCVDPAYRGLRIGQRLYNERKRLCRHLGLKGIVFGARIPGYKKHIDKYPTPEAYVQAVKDKKVRDLVLGFQMRNEFEPISVLRDYLPFDEASGGHAALMHWKNPQIAEVVGTGKASHRRASDVIRVGTVQYGQRPVESFEQFLSYAAYFVEVVADYRADFVTFPEIFTLQLLSLPEYRHLKPLKGIQKIADFTPRFREEFSKLAMKYNINIIGGTQPTRLENGDIQNIAYVFLRDGAIYEQPKIHPTPNERYWWNIKGGHRLEPIPTDCGPIGVLVCYDCEFPELSRHLIDQGAQILFVPFCTDERQSYLRVRYCAQARAVENQCYVVMSGNVGNLPGVENMDIQYAQSCILTPCDFPFARDGIAADTTPNVETVAIAELRIESLSSARNSGTVRNLADRRFDLYSLQWNTLSQGDDYSRSNKKPSKKPPTQRPSPSKL